MLRKIIVILILAGLPALSSAQVHGHYLFCLEVQNDSVLLQWDKPVDEDTFVRYWVVRAMESNPVFDTISEITYYDSTSFWDSQATANTQQNFYYIITDQSGVLPEIYSDTLSSIHLRVDNSDNHLAVLDWNAVHSPLLGFMDPLYRIMLLDADSNYVPIDSVDGFHYEFPVLLCRAELRFRIEMQTDIGCKSISNDYFAVFADTDAPSMPSLDSVSVDPFTGETLLGWSESSEADIGGYVVYHAHVTNDTLAFVYGKQNTSFLDTTANSCLAPKGYAIAAFDTCGNIGPGTYDIPQRTILLNEVVFHPCVMTSSISWTAYINMEPALQGYRLYLSIDSGAFTLLADLPASTLTFEHEDLAAGHHYRYFVRAYSINDAVTSSSCIKEYSTWQYRQPQSNALDIVTVVGSNWVEIGMLPDTFADLQSLKLYRSDQAAGPFNIIDELDPAGEELIFYDDLSAEVNLQSYYYRTTLVDSCGNEVLASQTMRTIFLQGDKLDAQKIALDWNAFEGWPEGVVNYQIYRAIGENGSFQSIAANQPGTLNFEDDISALSGQSNLIRYVIGAVRFGQLDYISYSNEITFEYEPALYLPNAFSPGGRNPVYKPVGTFAQFNEFRMDIYNRWGELIYTSQDYGEGWDGTHKGKIAPGGVYVCALYYRSNTGQSENMKQSFVLVR